METGKLLWLQIFWELLSQWIKTHMKENITSTIGKLLVQKFNKWTNMQTCDTRHFVKT